MKTMQLVALLLVMFIFTMMFCSDDESSTPTSSNNNPPEVSISADKTTVDAGQIVQLTATATDKDGDTLTYQWSANAGTFDTTTSLNANWTSTNSINDCVLTLTVSDGKTSISKTVTITVLFWKLVDLSQVTSDNLNGIYFPTSDEGWAVGALGTILHYTNGAWAHHTDSGVVTTSELVSVHFPTPNVGWAIGANSTILKYSNGNWSVYTNAALTGTFKDIHFYNENFGFIVNYKSDTSCEIFRCDGTNWTIDATASGFHLEAIYAYSLDNVKAVGYEGNTMQYNGTSWSNVKLSPPCFHGVYINGPQDVWYSHEGVSVRHYNGTGYSTLSLTDSGCYLHKMGFASVNKGWVVGSNGRIANLTYDGYSTATAIIDATNPLNGDTSITFKDISVINGKVWVCGSGGTILQF